ncbi:hypothetical protein Zmor_004565 [Zophobas morio]|uniref:Uncharacterized protein n=1 Tax=Zophobas morio TaxID=2755281 RepID=A0AA38MJP9_9CUCU|nr:hypothetical protein Zmor_014598 [Zophobas morio]KAJ3660095.1 hypothetical protein Zmor_004565 [Zophobas morio]
MASMGILLYEFIREGGGTIAGSDPRATRFAISFALSFPSLPLCPLIQQSFTLCLCVTYLSVCLHSQTSPDRTMQLSRASSADLLSVSMRIDLLPISRSATILAPSIIPISSVCKTDMWLPRGTYTDMCVQLFGVAAGS